MIALLIPVILKWKMIDIADNNNAPPVLIALKSDEYKTSLIVSLSVSIPMIFEVLLRIFLSAKLEFVLPNVFIMMSLAIPDLIILTYIRDSSDLSALNCVLKARFVLLTWIAFSFVKIHWRQMRCHLILLSSFIFVCISSSLDAYKVYFNRSISDASIVVELIMTIVAFILFIIVSIKWYYCLIMERNSHPLSNNQYMCNIYVSAFLLTSSGLVFNLYASPKSLHWFNWNTDELTIHTLMYTVFYVIVIVFEGRAIQREMLQTKVCNWSFIQNFIHQ